jgi:glycosyltransferase involved in cell wall biosynthesis
MNRRLEQWAIQRTPCFVANSQHGVDFLREAFDIPPERAHAIPNGIQLAPPDADRGAWRRRLEVGERDFLACMVANLTFQKDHTTLLRAWRAVVDQSSDRTNVPILLLAGYFGDAYDALRRLAQELQLGETVRFMGQVHDIPGLLSAVDLGVLSSTGEGSPNGVLECMAAGLPVVGTDIPGIREAIGPGGCAYLAPSGDAAALADRILMLAANPMARDRAGSANRRRIETTFAPEIMCEKMVRLMLRTRGDVLHATRLHSI